MFLKAINKKNPKGDKSYTYYRLCESYRIGDNTRHRTIMSLGRLDDLKDKKDRKLLADRIENLMSGNGVLFPVEVPEHIEQLAKGFYNSIIDKNKPSTFPLKKHSPSNIEDYQTIDVNTMEDIDSKEIGAEWMTKQISDRLGLEQILLETNMNKKQVMHSLTHIISRAVYPASEHKTAQWLKDNTGLHELFENKPGQINRNHLYSSGLNLLKHKNILENKLSTKTNELFDIEDQIILYDLTNTYFEGRKAASKKAKFGRSKEKRSDAKLLSLALVINVHGFVKYSKIYEGNISEPETLNNTIHELSGSTSIINRTPLIVMDAGIATEDNLAMMKKEGYQYICVTRSKLKDYRISDTEKTILLDNRSNPIEVARVIDPEKEDTFLYVRSQQKAKKEASMDHHFSQRFEQEIENVKNAIYKKGGIKKIEKVWERLGRIKERYPSANKHYNILVDSADGLATNLTITRKELVTKQTEGIYFLRTNAPALKETEIWQIYNTLTEIEATFRVLKTDLHLRPIYHQKDKSSDAHIFLGILAYTLVNTIRYQLKQKNINYDWKNIVRIMNTQKVTTTTMMTNKKKKLHVTKCSKPSVECERIYKALDLNPRPFYRKKFVLPQ